jgi:hypothetical protein
MTSPRCAGCLHTSSRGHPTVTSDRLPLSAPPQHADADDQLARAYLRCGLNERTPLVPAVSSILRSVLWQARQRLPSAKWLDGAQTCLRAWQAVGVPELANVSAETLAMADCTHSGSAASGMCGMGQRRIARTTAAIQPAFKAISICLAPLIDEIWKESQEEMAKVRRHSCWLNVCAYGASPEAVFSLMSQDVLWLYTYAGQQVSNHRDLVVSCYVVRAMKPHDQAARNDKHAP